MSEAEVRVKIKRPIRFKPQDGVYAFIDTRPNARRFSPQIACLVSNQSTKGFALVQIPKEAPEVGALIRVKVGPLCPLLAEVRWFEQLDERVFKVGYLFLE